jgi:hypothetical protein
MKKLIIVMLIILGSLTGCEKDNQLCGGNDPANDLPWLRTEINRLSSLDDCNSSISRSTYKNQTVFIFSICSSDLYSFPFPYLYDCEGNKMNLYPSDYQELKFTGEIELIWRSN